MAERERGIIITGSLSHNRSILTALLLQNIAAHHTASATQSIAETLTAPWCVVVSPDMDMEHMHHLLAEHHHAPILIIGDVPHVPFVKKPDFEHMLADKLGKEIQEIAKASAYYLFDDEALRHTKEQQKLRNRHYRGKMNSPKK